eukprot:2172405-Pleurochrysis_carterae.AAC.3
MRSKRRIRLAGLRRILKYTNILKGMPAEDHRWALLPSESSAGIGNALRAIYPCTRFRDIRAQTESFSTAVSLLFFGFKPMPRALAAAHPTFAGASRRRWSRPWLQAPRAAPPPS